MRSGASDAFVPSEGDYLAPPSGLRSEEAYFIAPEGERLSSDIRGVADEATRNVHR